MKKVGCLAALLAVALIGLAYILLIGTEAGDSTRAEEPVKAFYAALGVGEFDHAAALLSPTFFKKTPKEDTVQVLRTINAKLGALVSYQRVQWQETRQLWGESGTGVVYVFVYQVKYATSEAEETVTVFKPMGVSSAEIVGYNVNSRALASQ